MSEEPKPIHIIGLSVSNVKRITAAQIVPTSRDVTIGGRNGQGKSSLLDAIELAFRGSVQGKPCAVPLQIGAELGGTEIDCGEFIIRRGYRKGTGSSLTVRMKGGTAMIPAPQRFLDNLFGTISFDPLQFTNLPAEKQAETLRELCGVDTSMLDANHQATYDDRTEKNRAVARAKAEFEKLDAAVKLIAEPAEAVTLEGILEERKTALAANEANRIALLDVASAKTVLDGLESNQADRANEIAELRERIEEVERQIKDNAPRIAAAKTDHETKWQAARGLVDTDLDAIEEKLRNADKINTAKAKFVEWRAKKTEFETAFKESEAMTAELDDIAATKLDRIKKAAYPVKGLLLTDTGVTFEGVPFKQCSSALQLRVSVAMGVAANPRLRVLLVREGCFLDDQSLEQLKTLAAEFDVQIWIERVGTGDECEIIVEDGRIAEVRE